MKSFALFLILGIFIFSTVGAFAETPKDRISSGLDNIVYGQVEVPKNLTETGSKGKKAFASSTERTRDGVERGIARTVGGIWKILTFWNTDSE